MKRFLNDNKKKGKTMSAINVSELINDIKDAATGVLNDDITSIRGFSERQVKALAQHAQLVATGIATGGITDETRDYFLDGIEDMVMNFARTLRGLMLVTIEKVWNAIVGVVWRSISAATSIALPIPM